MSEEYICPKCNEPLETGVLFCGNCGQLVVEKQVVADQTNETTVIPDQVAEVYDNEASKNDELQSQYLGNVAVASPGISPTSAVPGYAIAYPYPKQHRAAIALALGILGMGAGLIVAIVGIGLGIVGVIMSTTSYKGSSKGLKVSSLVVSILAVLIGIGVWVNAVNHDPALHSQKIAQAGISNGTAALSVTTPCYSVGFVSELNINNPKGSCTMNAYNGTSLNQSSNIYKVLSNSVTGLSGTNFNSLTKKALETDVSKNLPGFDVTGESNTLFSGDNAYYIQANDTAENVAIIEEGVLHNTSAAQNNFFVIVHVSTGSSTNLKSLEAAWQWND